MMAKKQTAYLMNNPLTLNDDVKNYIQTSVLCWLATVDAEGCPNVSPKEIFTAYQDTHLIIANIASPNSVRNLLVNKNACVSFIHVLIQKGYKLHGQADIIEPHHAIYSELVQPLELMTKKLFPIHSIIFFKVEKIQAIVAPSYRLIPGTTHESQVKSAIENYGLKGSLPGQQ